MRTAFRLASKSFIIFIAALCSTRLCAVTVPAMPTGASPGTTSSPGPTQPGSTVTVRWSVSSGATYYDVGIRDIAAGTIVASGYPTATSFTATLTAGKAYRWNVAAGNTAGESSFTTPLYFQTPAAVTVPAMPTGASPGTTSSPGPTQPGSTVTVSWSASSGATYYDVGVRDIASGTLVASGYPTATSFTATLTAGKAYRWNVAAGNTAGESSFTTPLYFQTPAVALNPPAITSPGTGTDTGATVANLTPAFSWSAVSGATRYGFYLSKSPYGPENLVYSITTLTGSPFTLPSGYLVNGTKYRWEMTSFNSAGTESSVSSLLYFQAPAAALNPPTITSPGTGTDTGATVANLTPAFSWSAVSGATRYGFYLSKSPYGPANLVYSITTLTGSPFTLPSGYLVNGTKYRWQMTSFNSAGTESSASSLLYFQAPAGAVGPPTVSSPGTGTDTGATVASLTPAFSWSPVSGATRYGFYLSKSPYGPANMVYTSTSLTGSPFTLPSGYLVNGTKYRWQMTSFNSAGTESSASSLLYFQAPAGPPTLFVTPTSPNVTATAGTISFTVSITGGGTISYSAGTPSVDWLRVSSGVSGGNGGTIVVSYDSNPGVQRTGSVVVTAIGASGSPFTVTINQDAYASASVMLPNSINYIRQINNSDMQPKFNSSSACGPSSAVMILTYYNRLSPHPMIGKSGVNNNYSWYVAPIDQNGTPSSTAYSYLNFPFNVGISDPAGQVNYGAHGFLIKNSNVGTESDTAVQFFWKHGMWATADYLPTEAKVKSEIHAGRPVFLSTDIFENKTLCHHIMVIRGYNSTQVIAADPWVRSDLKDRDFCFYTWNYLHYNGVQKWMIKNISAVQAGGKVRALEVSNIRPVPSSATGTFPMTSIGDLGTIVLDTSKNSTAWNADGYTWVKVQWDKNGAIGWSAIGSGDTLWIEPYSGASSATHIVRPVAGSNGSISPRDPQTVSTFGSVPFTALLSSATQSAASKASMTMAATTVYVVDQWLVNGIVAQSGGTNFSLANVTSDTSVQVTFKPAPSATYIVTPSASANGSVSPSSPSSVESGSSVPFTAMPLNGYVVDQWLVNGVTKQSGGTLFTLGNVIAPTAVLVTFKAAPVGNNTITVSPMPEYGGTASGGGSFTNGSQRTVTASAKTGYGFINWTENGVEVSSLTNYTFMLTVSRSLVANFTATTIVGTDTNPPALQITQPYSSGVFVTTNDVVILKGVASDLGHGNNGISLVTVNEAEAFGDTAANGGTANWSLPVALNQGSNVFTVVAKDTLNNFVQQQINIILDQPPLITKRSPVSDPAAINEGSSITFSVTASDGTDPIAAGRGMSNVIWFVDGVRKLETKTGAPNAITSSYTIRTDASTVQGTAFRDVAITAVALDKQGGTAETTWTVRMNNVPSSQTISFPSFTAKALGDADFAPGAVSSSGLPVEYTSSNESVAKLVNGFVHIIAAGTAVITASQPGATDYKAATAVTQTLTVKARLTVELPAGGGTARGAGLYVPGSKVVLTATPSTGYTFLRWEDGTQTTGRSLVMPNANTTVSAWFGVTTNVQPPIVSDPGTQRAMVGVPFMLPLAVFSASLPNVSVSGLPYGLTYNRTTKMIAGVPKAAANNRIATISARNVNMRTSIQTFLITVDPLPAWAQGTFSGSAGTDELGSGSASMSVSMSGLVSGKLTLRGTNASFKANNFTSREADGSLSLITTAKVGKVSWPITMWLNVPRITDMTGIVPVTLSKAEGLLSTNGVVTMYRNIWKDPGMAEVIANYIGYYTATLPGGTEYGSGYLTFTIDQFGSVKTVGKLADDRAVSMSSTLILDEAGRVWAVLYTAPTTYKGGGLFGIVEFFKGPEGTKVIVKLLDGEPFVWDNLNPMATDVYGAGFIRGLGLIGGWYDKINNLYAYYNSRDLSIDTESTSVPELIIGTNRFDSAWWDPDGLSLRAVTNSLGVMTGLAAPAAWTPVKVDNVYEYADSTNAVGFKIALTRATGIFKGSFKAWFDYGTTHTSKTIYYEGAMTPERETPEDGVAGRGFFLWADKSQYLNYYNTLSPFSFNWSYNLMIMLSEPEL